MHRFAVQLKGRANDGTCARKASRPARVLFVQALLAADERSFGLTDVPGTDSRVGFGFRFGPLADAQVLLELGPQTDTRELTVITTSAEPDLGKRHVHVHDDPLLQEDVSGLRHELSDNHIRGRSVSGYYGGGVSLSLTEKFRGNSSQTLETFSSKFTISNL